MFQKIANVAAILSLLLSGGLVGGTYFGYKYVTSPQFKNKIKNTLMGDINKALPSVVGNQMPTKTGAGIPFGK
tara:strand:+ start:629 stop:847 length:219 start_codon:yes stop_codon:yes gene_type:complete